MDGVYFPRILFYNGRHGEIMDEIECTVASGPAVFIDYMASLGVGMLGFGVNAVCLGQARSVGIITSTSTTQRSRQIPMAACKTSGP